MKIQIQYLKEQLNTIKIKYRNSTIENNFDKDRNKFSQLETVNEVDKETFTKECIASLSRNNTNSLPDDNVEDI